jgi:hypothetical protein
MFLIRHLTPYSGSITRTCAPCQRCLGTCILNLSTGTSTDSSPSGKPYTPTATRFPKSTRQARSRIPLARWRTSIPVGQEGTGSPNDPADVSPALTPFHSNTVGTLYTSATAQYTKYFGYAYPEVVDWNVNSTQLSSNVRAIVNQIYNPTGSLSARSTALRRRQPGGTLPNAADYQWVINIEADK